jgi:imidazolonepropionase
MKDPREPVEADLLIRGASEVVTCAGPPGARSGHLQSEVGVIAGGAVAVLGSRIVFVGTGEEAQTAVRLRPGATVLDAAGGCVLPGLVDPHTHLPFAGWRVADFERRLAGASYSDIARAGGGIRMTVAATRAASREELAGLVRERLDRMLLHGTTTAEAKSGYGLTLPDELKQLEALAAGAKGHPVEVVPTLLGAHVVPPEFAHARAGYVRLVAAEMVPAAASAGLAEFCDVFVEEGAFTAAEARVILDAARSAGLGLRLHAEQFTVSGGAALAAEYGAASVDHLEEVAESVAKALAARRVVAVLLPGASLFAGGGRGAPGRMLIGENVAVAIASDFNPGTCPCESVAAMIPIACLLCGLTPDEGIVAATINAAAALGRADRLGSLEPGKQADLAIFDVPDRRHLAYRFGTNHCRTVVKAGRVVVRDGQREP